MPTKHPRSEESINPPEPKRSKSEEEIYLKLKHAFEIILEIQELTNLSTELTLENVAEKINLIDEGKLINNIRKWAFDIPPTCDFTIFAPKNLLFCIEGDQTREALDENHRWSIINTYTNYKCDSHGVIFSKTSNTFNIFPLLRDLIWSNHEQEEFESSIIAYNKDIPESIILESRQSKLFKNILLPPTISSNTTVEDIFISQKDFLYDKINCIANDDNVVDQDDLKYKSVIYGYEIFKYITLLNDPTVKPDMSQEEKDAAYDFYYAWDNGGMSKEKVVEELFKRQSIIVNNFKIVNEIDAKLGDLYYDDPMHGVLRDPESKFFGYTNDMIFKAADYLENNTNEAVTQEELTSFLLQFDTSSLENPETESIGGYNGYDSGNESL